GGGGGGGIAAPAEPESSEPVASAVESGTATFDEVEEVEEVSFEQDVETEVTITPETPDDDEVPIGNGVVTGISAETDTDTSGVEREITFTVEQSAVESNSLVVAHESDGEWSELETTVTEDGDSYRVTATADSFSRFVVVETGTESEDAASVEDESDEESDDTEAGSDTDSGGSDTEQTGDQTDDTSGATDNETDDAAGGTTGDSTPGFGIIVSLIALLAALAVARARS
ncbi:PGF-CTERM sorting domain-containing protein, partial [Halorubrum pallidum]